MPFSVTDLFLRARAKVRATDLWLHPKGPVGDAPPPIRDSGTNVITISQSGVGALVDAPAVETGGGGPADRESANRHAWFRTVPGEIRVRGTPPRLVAADAVWKRDVPVAAPAVEPPVVERAPQDAVFDTARGAVSLAPEPVVLLPTSRLELAAGRVGVGGGAEPHWATWSASRFEEDDFLALLAAGALDALV